MKWARKVDPLDRLMGRVTKTDSCWIWTGALRNGYGAIGVEGKTLYTHRYVYQRVVGPVPTGLDLDHLCRNRTCCNPDHLEPVTRQENLRRAAIYRSPVTACHNGHEYTAKNTYTNPSGYRTCKSCKAERQTRSAA